MRYIELTEYGGPEVLQLREGKAPACGPGELLIEVHAAGVNRPDIFQRMGVYPPPSGASPILGLEVAGIVTQAGDGVTGWRPGEKVCALTNGGGYAQTVAVPAGQCLPVPEGKTFEEAAAIPEAFFTVWVNVFDIAAMKEGERFLVHGGTSGIGTTAIQMAKARGAWVAATAGSEEKCALCERLGADLVVNHRTSDYVSAVKKATEGKGADVILDMVGGDYVQRNLDLAATDGRIVSIAFLKGSRVEIDLQRMLFKRLTITGSTLRSRSAGKKAAIARQLRSEIWPLVQQGQIRPVIDSRFPLEKAAEAHRRMESRRHMGKIVLTVR